MNPPSLQPELQNARTLATVALICSLSTIILTGPLGSLAGVICGHIALNRYKKLELQNGRSLAVVALWLGYLFTILIILLVIGFFYFYQQVSSSME